MKKIIGIIAIVLLLNNTFASSCYAVSTSSKIDMGTNCVFYISNGVAKGFGMNYNGRFGFRTPDENSYDSYVFDDAIIMENAKQVTAPHTSFFSLYTDNSGVLFGAGTNSDYQLGIGTNTTQDTLVKILDNVVIAKAGKRFSVALTSNGELYGWGRQMLYFMGDDNLNYTIPQKIFDNVRSFSCSDYTLVIITKDNKLYRTSLPSLGETYGTDDEGLGRVPGFHFVSDKVKNVSCDDNSIFYVDTNGALWAIGSEEYGKFLTRQSYSIDDEPIMFVDGKLVINSGVKKPINTNEPFKIIEYGVEKVLTTGTEMFYLKYDGTLYGVGYNSNGIMGLGWQPYDDIWHEKYSHSYPIFEIGTNVIDFAADDFNMGYITKDRKLYISGTGAKRTYEKSLYFAEQNVNIDGENNLGTLINRVGPYKMSLTIGSDTLCCIDKNIKLEVPAQIIGERTFVPLRAVFEAIGAEVLYDEKNQIITSKTSDIEVIMQIGSRTLKKNGTEIKTDAAPLIINERTMIPLRAVAEAFGCSVVWDEHSNTAVIN